jgi:hypothetical protein
MVSVGMSVSLDLMLRSDECDGIFVASALTELGRSSLLLIHGIEVAGLHEEMPQQICCMERGARRSNGFVTGKKGGKKARTMQGRTKL